MTSLAKFGNNSESIFDSIKHIEDGIEVWYARELMVALGYKSWQKFEGVICVAKENLESVVDSVFHHITPRDNMAKRQQGGGRTQSDFRLSRLGSYHIALSCDSRGNERVKLAKHYFAVKTYQAETVIPIQKQALSEAELRIKELELQLAIATATKESNLAVLSAKQLDNTMLTLHGAPTVLALRGCQDQIVEIEKPTIEVIDEKSGARFKGMSTTDVVKYVSKMHGFKYKSGADVKRYIESSGNGHLLAQTPRRILTDYIPEENIEEVIKLLTSGNRQLLLGE